MIIPWEKLSGQALEGIIEEYVLREGTDYGQRDFSLDQKKSDIKKQLERAEVQITFLISPPIFNSAKIMC